MPPNGHVPKTISLYPADLERLDRLREQRKQPGERIPTRSELIREAIAEKLEREEQVRAS